MSQVKLISEYYVRPQIEVDESNRKYFLGALDLGLLSRDATQFGYLYIKPNDYSPTAHLERLKISLSQTLDHFYPLAGRLVTEKYENEHSCSIYVDCHKGQGVRLIHATAMECTVDDIVSPKTDVPLVAWSFFELGERAINYDGHTRALFSAQITELKDGVFLAFSINHSVGDGTTLNKFITVWSKFCMGLPMKFICKPIYHKPPFLDTYPIIKLPYLEPEEFLLAQPPIIPLRERVFSFSANSIKLIKAKTNAEPGNPSLGTYDISSYLALTAFVWTAITRGRNLPLDEVTNCVMPVNLRPRFEPPLSEDYFGNFYVLAKGTAKVGDLLGNGLKWAALRLQEAVFSKDDKAARKAFLLAYDRGPEMLAPKLGTHSTDVSMSGVPRFDIYGPQFGLGKALTLASGMGNKSDGRLSATAGCEGPGSVELAVCLAPDTMEALLADEEFMTFAFQQNNGMSLPSRL